jgi:hypothetical protein
MKDTEIIKALECCLSHHINTCERCPFENKCYGGEDLMPLVIDLINRQKAEIERLEKNLDEKNEELDKVYDALADSVKISAVIRAEAVTEFAERLKATMEDFARMDFRGSTYFCVGLHHIDNLVKEFPEGKADEDK